MGELWIVVLLLTARKRIIWVKSRHTLRPILVRVPIQTGRRHHRDGAFTAHLRSLLNSRKVAQNLLIFHFTYLIESFILFVNFIF